MTSESNRISGASIAYIHGVSTSWGWAWQPLSQENDDGIDGLLYLRIKKVNAKKVADRRSWTHVFTGGMIHVQIKSGVSYVSEETQDHILLNVQDLEKKRKLWEISPLPCILVYVQPADQGSTPKRAWWADLKIGQTYISKHHIEIPKKNRFQAGIECVKPLARLARRQLLSNELQVIDLTGPSAKQINILGGKGLKWEAWQFYNKWRQSTPHHPILGPVIVNRTGWSHITRPNRSSQRIANSFLLLPAAARIIEDVKGWRVLSRAYTKDNQDGSYTTVDFIGISARIQWSHRVTSEVMVILRRRTTFRYQTQSEGTSLSQDFSADTAGNGSATLPETQLWFYSVYEPGRGKR